MKIGKVEISGGPNIQWYIFTLLLFILSWKIGLAWILFNLVIAALVIAYLNLGDK